MRKAHGTGGLYLRGKIWWLKFSVGGRMLRQSTGLRGGSKGKPPKEAQLVWAQKLTEIGRGNLAGVSGTVRFEDIESALITRYTAENRLPALRNAKSRLVHLSKAFGGWPASSITEDAILAYAVKRRDKDGAAVDTVNLELSYLRRGFRLLKKRLPTLPEIRHLPGARARQGTVTTDQFTQLVAKLGPLYGAVAQFLRLTGWRCSEGCGLEWRRVDWKEKLIRLDTSKSGEPRVLAFGRYRRLEAVLRLQRLRQRMAGLVVPYVFHRRSGKQVLSKNFRTAWTRARNLLGYHCRVHDLRRTRVVELERAGVPITVGMSSVGMKSTGIYRRYGVVSPAEQAEWMDCGQEEPIKVRRLGK